MTPPETLPFVLSASTLTGDKVVNRSGEDLGKIEDLVITLDTGRVAYAVLSFGGILGMGTKLFAVPWSSLTVDSDNKQVVIPADKDKLENAPGFDKDDWPDFADPTLAREIHAYYGVDVPNA